MGSNRLSPKAESELDEIWLYLAKRSGSLDVADRFIDAITERFYLLANNHPCGRDA